MLNPNQWNNYQRIREPESEIYKLKNKIGEQDKKIRELEKLLNHYKTVQQDLNLKIDKKDEKISELNEKIKKEKQNTNKIEELKNQLTKDLGEKNEMIDKKNKEIDNLKIELFEPRKKNEILLKNEIEEKKEIISKTNEINQLKDKCDDLRKKNEKKNIDYIKLDKEYQKLKEEKNKVEEQLNRIKERIKYLSENNRNIYKLEEKLKKIDENADKSSKYQDLKKEDFYDIIIKCNSIIGLKNGWEIAMTEAGRKKYNEYKKTELTKIGVIGSENRGKSTILSDFSQIELPTGVSIKTEGLSIKYPELEKFKNRKIILLDSAGLETPILKKNNEENKIDNIIEEKIEEKKENENEEFQAENKKENVQEKFQNISRDKIHLELFLQNFIIKYSDILILILGKLTINEQKLLLKVNAHIKNLNRKKPLIVIHNLKDFETKNQIDDYLENILKKSSTFSLEENDEINLNCNESGWKPLYEPNSDPKIFHLIYGRKGSEAGDFYNKKAIDFIYSLISSNTDNVSFDPIECVKTYFSEISEIILDNPIAKTEMIYNGDVQKDLDKNLNANEVSKIILKDQSKKINLKKCLIDELGISTVGNGFDAQYSYYITDKNVFVYVELPGKKEKSSDDIEYENVEIENETEGSYSIIKITGTKKHYIEHFNKEKVLIEHHHRQFGEFSILIRLDKINLEDNSESKIDNGCLLISFKKKKKNNKKKV